MAANVEQAPAAEEEIWVDVTADMTAVAASLGVDELLQAPTFSLYDSMSALELMDPEMDALGSEPPQRTVAELLPELPVELTPATAVVVLDRLLALEAVYHGGASLHDSVLECAVLRDPATAALSAVTPAAQAVAQTANLALWVCEASREVIVAADIFEEEDFATSTNKVSRAAQEARRRGRAFAALAEDAQIDDARLQAHVAFRRALAQAVQKLATDRNEDDAGATDRARAALKELDALDEDPSDGDLAIAGRWFVACRDEHATTRGVSPPKGGWASAKERTTTRDAFRQLLKGLDRVWDLRRCLAALRFSDESSSLPSLPSVDARRCEHAHSRLLRLCSAVGHASRGGGRFVLPRSFAALEMGGAGAPLRQLLNQDDFGAHASATRLGRGPQKTSVFGIVVDSIVSGGAPNCVVQCRAGAEFASRAAKCVLHVLRAVACANRARLRQQLPGLLLDWAALVEDARQADASCAAALGLPEDGDHVRYLGTWALKHSLQLMERTLALDVSLQLVVTPSDLEHVFWYREYVLAACSTLAQDAKRQRVLLRDSLAEQPDAPVTSEEDRRLDALADARDAALEASLRGARCLCRATHLVCAARVARDAATSDGGQTYVYASRRTRFAKRFSAFACFAEPAPITYEDYERVSLKQRAACEDLTKAASQLFGSAAQLVDHALKLGKTSDRVLHSCADAEDLVALKRVAVSNRVGLARADADADPAPKFALDLAAHEDFPVVKGL